MRGLSHGRACLVLRSGEVVDPGFGSLTFEKPSTVKFEDNTVDTEFLVSRRSIRRTTGLLVPRGFRDAGNVFVCPSGVPNSRPSEPAPLHARIGLFMLHARIERSW